MATAGSRPGPSTDRQFPAITSTPRCHRGGLPPCHLQAHSLSLPCPSGLCSWSQPSPQLSCLHTLAQTAAPLGYWCALTLSHQSVEILPPSRPSKRATRPGRRPSGAHVPAPRRSLPGLGSLCTRFASPLGPEPHSPRSETLSLAASPGSPPSPPRSRCHHAPLTRAASHPPNPAGRALGLCPRLKHPSSPRLCRPTPSGLLPTPDTPRSVCARVTRVRAACHASLGRSWGCLCLLFAGVSLPPSGLKCRRPAHRVRRVPQHTVPTDVCQTNDVVAE